MQSPRSPPSCAALLVGWRKQAAHYTLDGIITVVDANQIMERLGEVKPDGCVNEASEQLAFADRILLNKVDLVPDAADLTKIKKKLRSLNPHAPILQSKHSQIDPKELIGIQAFSIARALEVNAHTPSHATTRPHGARLPTRATRSPACCALSLPFAALLLLRILARDMARHRTAKPVSAQPPGLRLPGSRPPLPSCSMLPTWTLVTSGDLRLVVWPAPALVRLLINRHLFRRLGLGLGHRSTPSS